MPIGILDIIAGRWRLYCGEWFIYTYLIYLNIYIHDPCVKERFGIMWCRRHWNKFCCIWVPYQTETNGKFLLDTWAHILFRRTGQRRFDRTMSLPSPLQWRHNGRDGVSNHQPHDCLLNRLFTNQRKHQSSASLAFVRWIHQWRVNSPHKWPVTRKMFPFDDVIIHYWRVRSLHQQVFGMVSNKSKHAA